MKNKFMRAAVILMALVLMTSCFVGGTFAKYVTAGNADDSARVAKFGVVVSASDGAFYETYDSDSTYSGLTVEADTKVVAPGTEGNFATIELSGTPEVAVEVAYAAEVSLSDAWVNEAGEYYCPIIVTVDGTDYVGTSYDSAAEFAADIQDAITGYTAEYEPGTDLSALNGGSEVAISWEWPFEDTTSSNGQNDIDDTYLGDQAADGNAATISIVVDVTVTQID